ncbi:transposase [Streptomyces sp. NPDC002730]|uniref:transposase n=1 Tax=Streptomyces sp. NPDC002730 TaxID=3364662 RepID=UPI0036C499D1
MQCSETTGFRRFDVHAAWLELSLAAINLLTWTRVLLLDDELTADEPKKLRYRLLHVAARITHGGRRLHARLAPPQTTLLNHPAASTETARPIQ